MHLILGLIGLNSRAGRLCRNSPKYEVNFIRLVHLILRQKTYYQVCTIYHNNPIIFLSNSFIDFLSLMDNHLFFQSHYILYCHLLIHKNLSYTFHSGLFILISSSSLTACLDLSIVRLSNLGFVKYTCHIINHIF